MICVKVLHDVRSRHADISWLKHPETSMIYCEFEGAGTHMVSVLAQRSEA